MKNKYVYISEKKNQWLFKFLEAKNSQKSLKFDKFAKKRRVLQFFGIFFFKFTRLFSIENKHIYISEKINQWLFKFLEIKNSQKSLKFDKFAKNRRVLQFFAIFFFKFTGLISIKNKYIYISEKINQWLFKVWEAKNYQKSLKFSKFTKKRQLLQCRPANICLGKLW